MKKLWLLLVLGFFVGNEFVKHADGQEENRQPKEIRAVNLFLINDEENDIAQSSITNSLKGVKDKNPDWLGNIIKIQINTTDPQGALEKICKTWDEAVRNGGPGVPDLVLDTTRSGFGAETVGSFTKAVGVPTLSAQFGQTGDLPYWRDLTPDQAAYLIQIMPPADLVPEVIRQMASTMGISNIAIIFNSDFVMDHKYKSLLLNIPTRHVIVRSKSPELMERQLQQLRNLDIVNYFVLGDQATLNATIQAAEANRFTGRKFGWYAASLDEFYPAISCRNLSLLFFKPLATAKNQQAIQELTTKGLLRMPYITAAFYYDLARLGIEAMRLAIKDKEWGSEPKHITCEEYNEKNTPQRELNLLKKLKQLTDDDPKFQPTFAGFQFGNQNGEHKADFEMQISRIVIGDGDQIASENLGTWTAGIDSPVQFNSLDREKVQNHSAIVSFRIAVVITPPFIIYDEKTGVWSGYCIDLLGEIQKLIPFEYEVHEVADKQFGFMTENGTWNGLIRELMDKKADIALGALSVMAERENVVDFTVPYYDLVGISILMLKPKPVTSLFKFLTVLETEVWLCILGSYFFTSFLMWLFNRWSPYSYQNNKQKYRDDDDKRDFCLKECLWFCMTSLTPQGGGDAPKNLSGRLVAATWWLFGFIIIASYTANLAAFLTVSRLETPIESLDDLSKQYKIQYAPIKPSEAYTYFERMADIETRFYEIWKDISLNDSLSDIERAKLAVWDYPVSDKYTKMFQAMKESGFPSSREEAVRRVRKQIGNKSNTEFAFIGDATDIRYLDMTNCDLQMVGDEFSRKPYAIAVQQGSPLKDQFNNAILQLLNQRSLEKFKTKWWSQNPNKVDCAKEENQSDGISIQNIGGVFIVIFIGIILACITLAFEYWWYRYRPRQLEAKKNAADKNSTKNVKSLRLNLKPARPNVEVVSGFRSRF